jgi:hypothetical protein
LGDFAEQCRIPQLRSASEMVADEMIRYHPGLLENRGGGVILGP